MNSRPRGVSKSNRYTTTDSQHYCNHNDKHVSTQGRPPWYHLSHISHVVSPEEMLLVVVETSISPPLIYITQIIQNVRIITNVPPIHAPIALPHEVTRPQPPSMSCLLYTSDAADDLLCVDLG